MKQERIDRINTLYHKSQAVGLTEEEKKEQAALRSRRSQVLCMYRKHLPPFLSHQIGRAHV